jgi:hypothetical protein
VEFESIRKMLVWATDTGYSISTMRSMCDADAGCLAINLSRRVHALLPETTHWIDSGPRVEVFTLHKGNHAIELSSCQVEGILIAALTGRVLARAK